MMKTRPNKTKPHNLRQYAKQTNLHLSIGLFLLVISVGVGMISLIWGGNAALAAIFCVIIAIGIFALIFLVLWIMERIARHD